MKYKSSRYNFFIDTDVNKRIIFNGVTGFSLETNVKDSDTIQTLINNTKTLEEKYPSMLIKMLDWGLIIPFERDEVTQLLFQNNKEVFLDKHYSLTINPTLECNFDCWYCYERKTSGQMSAETIEAVKKHLDLKIAKEQCSSIRLSWFGGEPLLYFEEIVMPIAKYAKRITTEADILFVHQVTTNGYLITKRMVEQFKEIGLNSFQITLDGNEEKHNSIRNNKGNPSFRTIVSNVNLICDEIKDASVILRINYDDNTLRDIKPIYSMFSEKNKPKIIIDFQKVWQIPAKKDNTDLKDTIDLCKQNDFQVSYNLFDINQAHVCEVDLYNHREINFDGSVFCCTARGYGEEHKVGKLLNNGVIEENKDKIAQRYLRAGFDNHKCLKCKYLPMCKGPCSQKVLEANGDIESICYLRGQELKYESKIIDFHHNKVLANKANTLLV